LAKNDIRVPVAYTSYRLKPRDKIKPLGLTKFGKKTISVSKALSDHGQWSNTFWHEWIHAVTYEGGYDGLNDNEAFVEFMAGALMRMFTDPVGRALIERMLKHLDTQPKKKGRKR
jgi:hypothetical protein